MRALNLKLLRDLWLMRAQGLAIALVIAGGVATWVISHSTIDSLDNSRRVFYQDYRFAEVFASLKRAPRSVLRQIGEIDGVIALSGRIRITASIEVAAFDEPIEGLITSIPDRGQPELNRVFLKAGQLPDVERPGEVVVAESFAEAHGLAPGDGIEAVIRGRATELRISGIGLSPEFVYQIQPGSLFPDHRRYAVMWMRRDGLERAADMDGAFNDVALITRRGTSLASVIERLDTILARWGGIGAISREDQTSHSYLDEEMDQLRAMARIVPVIFLGVAAFLLNIVIHRLVGMQRDQIAILKAFGYRNRTIALHFCALVLLIAVVGIVPGVAAGAWMGHGLASIYREFFRFPQLYYEVAPAVIAGAALITASAALIGTGRALWQAFRLQPAEAMRPEQPRGFKLGLAEWLPPLRRMSQPSRMIIRNLERRPLKALLAVFGISLAVAILVTGRFQQDTIDYMLDVQFGFAAREDLSVTFTEASGRDALHELSALPGVIQVEPYRSVPVELIHGHRRYRSVIQGFSPDAELHRALDHRLDPIEMPPDGLLLTDWLAGQLEIRPGQLLTVQVLEKSRRRLDVAVAGTVREFVGARAYMRLDQLNRIMNEGGSISGAYILADQQQLVGLYDEMKRRPGVASSNLREAAVQAFRRTMGENIVIFSFINTLLAGIIAFGVTYNTARLALSERGRELASLRVLGFRRIEIAWILIGELLIVTLAAIPLGLWIGYGFCRLIGTSMASEFYRIPTIIHSDSYVFAALVVLVAMLVSALAIGRRLWRMDLVEVLKTRE